jgi:hypothetical protein
MPARDQHTEPRATAIPSRNIECVAIDVAAGAVPQQVFEVGLSP